jgi:LacI family transcriptional regulator
MVRIKDVAEHAGVSTATVSRVINGKSVRPRFRKAVERSVKELGFRPNRQARLLRLQRSNEVALILPDIENPFYTTLARGVIDVTRACITGPTTARTAVDRADGWPQRDAATQAPCRRPA